MGQKKIFVSAAILVLALMVAFPAVGLLAGESSTEAMDLSITESSVLEAYGKLPLLFIENHGQVDEAVKYYVKASGQAVYADVNAAATTIIMNNDYSITANFMDVEAGNVGIKAGDWIKFEYTITGLPAGQPYIKWSKLEFLSVEGTIATVSATMHGSDGTEQSDTVSVDVVSDGEVPGFSRGIISANLTTGDSFNITGYGHVINVTIEGETTKTYAGANRTVVYASFSRDEAQLTYYWDKLTGVVVEASITYSGITATIKATKTNMWEAITVRMPWWPWIIVGVAVVGLVIFFLRRRKAAWTKGR